MWYSFAKKFFKNDVQSQKPTYSVDKIQDIQAIVGNAIAYFRSAALIKVDAYYEYAFELFYLYKTDFIYNIFDLV